MSHGSRSTMYHRSDKTVHSPAPEYKEHKETPMKECPTCHTGVHPDSMHNKQCVLCNHHDHMLNHVDIEQEVLDGAPITLAVE